ncbi:MAG TPA: cytochrome c oxidase subunit 3 [Gammaproteobacteria bacterium]|jgi:cytochrome c oxidase subunit 3|nr:cytochrome c oxidase subunit 3 [Gammaproteobacteria bacterium]
MEHAPSHYYVPHGTRWPIVGSIGLFTLLGGFSLWLNQFAVGSWIALLGFAIVLVMVFGWFGVVIGENQRGLYNLKVDSSFRWGMSWFIFSEIMFFGVFFGALFYTRVLVTPWLAGQGKAFFTHALLWPNFENAWPSVGPANHPVERMEAWGIPALNTAILLLSGVTITIAHHALRARHRGTLIVWLAATFVLGFIFLGFQAYEYIHAYTELGLKLNSGIYGGTFFMLTGFHGLHVTLGAIMLVVIWLRVLRGHFTPERHFAFEAVAWYWHFVDVVWLGLFFFVYWL